MVTPAIVEMLNQKLKKEINEAEPSSVHLVYF